MPEFIDPCEGRNLFGSEPRNYNETRSPYPQQVQDSTFIAFAGLDAGWLFSGRLSVITSVGCSRVPVAGSGSTCRLRPEYGVVRE